MGKEIGHFCLRRLKPKPLSVEILHGGNQIELPQVKNLFLYEVRGLSGGRTMLSAIQANQRLSACSSSPTLASSVSSAKVW